MSQRLGVSFGPYVVAAPIGAGRGGETRRTHSALLESISNSLATSLEPVSAPGPGSAVRSIR